MSRICHVNKAQPISQSSRAGAPLGPVEAMAIYIDEEIPASEPAALAATFEADAIRLVDALLDALPGGTVDQLLCELLRRRACLFRVRFPATDGGADV